MTILIPNRDENGNPQLVDVNGNKLRRPGPIVDVNGHSLNCSGEGFGEELTPEALDAIAQYQVMMVIGGGKGDEGKGGDAYALAKMIDYDLIVSPVGGPNAGHTVITDDGREFIGHNLPGAAVTGKTVFLGQGKLINIAGWKKTGGLEKELNDLEAIGVTSNIKIAENATPLFSTIDGVLDGAIEEAKTESGTKVGTTKQGVGPGEALRAFRVKMTMGQLLNMSDEAIVSAVNVMRYAIDDNIFGPATEQVAEIKEHRQKLQDLERKGTIEIVSNTYAQDAYNGGEKILIEGAQSPSLGRFSGSYPNCTPTDTNTLGILSSLGIFPEPGKFGEYDVVKLFPSAVGTHEFPEQISKIYEWLLTKEIEFGAKTGEHGATTKRPRMIGLPSPALLAYYIKNNPYTAVIALRKIDRLIAFYEVFGEDMRTLYGPNKLPIVADYKEDGSPIVETIDSHRAAIRDAYLGIIQDISGRKIDNMVTGHGPKPSESRVHVRGRDF